jgi:hypothetical protein
MVCSHLQLIWMLLRSIDLSHNVQTEFSKARIDGGGIIAESKSLPTGREQREMFFLF